MNQIETARLILREFQPEDAADLQEILGDWETMRYCEPPYDLEKTKSFDYEEHRKLFRRIDAKLK